MPITDKARKYKKAKSTCAEPSYVPRARIAAARRLLRIKHSFRNVRIAKRVAWSLIKTPNISDADRISAVRLLEYAMGWATVPDDIDDGTEDLATLTAPAELPKLAPTPSTMELPPGAIPVFPETMPPPYARSIVTLSNGKRYFKNDLGTIIGQVSEGSANVEGQDPRPVVTPFPDDL